MSKADNISNNKRVNEWMNKIYIVYIISQRHIGIRERQLDNQLIGV